MKEAIYTIPVTEAFETDCTCPFCYLYSKLENEAVSYTLGASMMEPDARSVTNQQGFCSKHFPMLFAQPNKLSLALVLETHLESVRSRLDLCGGSVDSLKQGGKKPLFSKTKSSGAASCASMIAGTLKSIDSTCAICSKIDATMERYVDVFFYLWSTDSGFRQKYEMQQGFCLPHYHLLVRQCLDYLKGKQQADFLQDIYQKQQQHLTALQQDIHRFTLKFDYRNQDMPWENAKDAPKRLIETLSGPIEN